MSKGPLTCRFTGREDSNYVETGSLLCPMLVLPTRSRCRDVCLPRMTQVCLAAVTSDFVMKL